MSILPKLFPPFPDEPEFDIYSTIEPAKEVGGDLYDFYHLDEHHLCFVIGDVSGKGIPASLFMAVAKTLIKATASNGLDPAEILSKVNDELARDNDVCMFVTVFLGILDLRTGDLEYANGGHNPPLIVPGRGDIEFVKRCGGALVGAMEGIVFESSRIVMAPGDMLFLYTDGVTEAMNEHMELFSEERLKRNLTSLRDRPIKEIVAGVLHEVHHFSQWVEQSDDITMMAVKYWGRP
ncbi:MAG: serine/threonine-protein phosphatase [Deltaproteobacteria bacterium]|nr:serine/threonine-protein phosphatase [Deltaproteobacteria bacterium]